LHKIEKYGKEIGGRLDIFNSDTASTSKWGIR